MRYKNYTTEAIYELENQRTMNYNDTDNDITCDNGCFGKELYSVNGQILCQDCLIDEIRDTFDKILACEDDDSFSAEIIKDIISDFSDTEILTYLENRYDKI